jgi:hypothetical protein
MTIVAEGLRIFKIEIFGSAVHFEVWMMGHSRRIAAAPTGRVFSQERGFSFSPFI